MTFSVSTRVPRRTLIKRSLQGLLVIGPLAKVVTAVPVYAAPCQQITWKVVRQYCDGPDLVKVEDGVDRYDPSILCELMIAAYSNEITSTRPRRTST